jgi:hypothetical protein
VLLRLTRLKEIQVPLVLSGVVVANTNKLVGSCRAVRRIANVAMLSQVDDYCRHPVWGAELPSRRSEYTIADFHAS